MDLLGGYDSDSGSDNDSASPPVTSQPKPNVTKPTVSSKPVTSANPSTKISSAPNASSTSSTTSRKGKRLLKLQAVLPENIWNQLTNGNLQKDSDDDESDEEGKTRTRSSNKRKKASQSNASQNPGDKSDMTNLLQALPMSKTSTGLVTSKSILQDSDDFSNTVIGSSSNNPEKSSSTETKSSFVAPLGAAFLTSTVETVRKKKSAPTDVRDIHGTSSTVAVETVGDDESDDDEDEPDGDQNASTTASTRTSSSLHATVSSTSFVPRPGMSSSTTSTFARARMAAPPVSGARYQQHESQPSYPLPPGTTPYGSNPVASMAPSQARPGGGGKKGSRKREMERMLREGNFDGVASDIHLEGQANVYQPPEQVQQQAYQSHGIRMAATAQYNVGTGGIATTAKVSGKQRGKNQMNALLSNAVSLEAERARNPLPQQKVQRANAKRKYGW